MSKLPNVIVVVGPTASGKSDFAVELALKHNGEIISADSRQVYKGLDIGTGKITEVEMKGVKHHMLSVYELGEEVSVARFARDTSPILTDILTRGKTPIICGGTGQYIDALIYETSIPHVEPDNALRETLEKKSTEELVSILKERDPKRAEAIDTHNRVRLIRAIEITESLGTVPVPTPPKLRFDVDLYLMNPTRELLRTRIAKRLEKRLMQGMIEEVRTVIDAIRQSKKNDTTSVEASLKKFGLEYVAIGKYLEGDLSLEAMKEELITTSMQYAKRQQTWNKKYLPIATIIEIKE